MAGGGGSRSCEASENMGKGPEMGKNFGEDGEGDG